MSEHSALLILMPFWQVETPHLALPYVAAIFQQAGWRCKVVDLNVQLFRAVSTDYHWMWQWPDLDTMNWRGRELLGRDNLESLNRFLRELAQQEDHDLFAFAVNCSNLDMSLRASRLLKSLNLRAPVLFGGPECFPHRSHSRLLLGQGAPDILCQGEAEVCLPMFLEQLADTGDYRTGCKGFVYVDNDRIVDNSIPDLPSFTKGTVRPDWEQIDFSMYKDPGAFSSFLSRGCPYSCSFCSESPSARRFRFRKAEELISEIKDVIKIVSPYAKKPTLYFADLLINGNIKELEKLCDMMIQEDMGIAWRASARLRPQMSRPLLDKMNKAGCELVWWGMETASQRVLDLMKKKVDSETARRILRESHEAGITNMIMLLVGFPGETPEDFVTSVMAVKELREYGFFVNPQDLELDPGSRIHQDPQRWGVVPAQNIETEWVTADMRNDSQVRALRRLVLINAIFNESLSLRSARGLDDILQLDFNRLSVASEIAAVLHELWRTVCLDGEMMSFVTEWDGEAIPGRHLTPDELQYWTPASLPRDVSLENWFNRDKNGREQKLKICLKVFAAIRYAYKPAPKAAL